MLTIMLYSFKNTLFGGKPMNAGDTAFVLFSAALVMLMTLGLAFFYGGLVRSKNVLSIIMQCLGLASVLSIVWIIIGYSLSFAPGSPFIGGLKYLFLHGVTGLPNPEYSDKIPHLAFMLFQGMFAVITPALIIGAFAERIKYSAFLLFSILWALFVYNPLAHWIWGSGGWLSKMGFIDFAGGVVVHLSAGIAAIVMCILIGKRKGFPEQPILPHNIPMVYLGLTLLWFGWFGFNGGSALSANSVAAYAFVATNTAAAAAALTWALIEWISMGAPTTVGAATGAVAGLAAVTPASGFVSPISAMIIGVISACICYFFVAVVKQRLGYDDSLDVFGVHGIGGITGTLCAGLFAQTVVNPSGPNGLFFGNPHQFIVQLIGVGADFIYTLILTIIIGKFVDVVIGLRVSEEEEEEGLDVSQHKETAYTV